ncbi:MAG: murein biosynthesis integral membrane protein MurJ, partial [Candidatus Omnitrophica bacterium]|nr:murein biosynthesis integral membrane protein MurJ [Candidatus Omnitrophota bacterium]
AWAMGILNSFKHFTAPALAPVMLNICWIGSLFLLVPYFGDTLEEKIFGLAIGILLGGFLQLAIQIPGLVSRGVKFGFNPAWSHPGLKQIVCLMAPAMFGLAITQLNMLVDLMLANFVGYGANSTLWYGNRLVQLPLGVFAISLSTAVLPVMSEHMTTNDIDKLKQTLIFTMKLVFLILIPASLGLIILRVPIIRLLFEHGRFDAESTRRTASVLLFYSLGLFAYGGIHVVVKAYYSLKDTRTPVRIGIIALISNICLNLILMQYLREGGLALATTLSSMLNFALLVFILSKKIGSWGLKEIFILFLKVLLSAGIMAAAAQMLITSLPVLLIIPISIIIFFICCFIFKVEEAGMLLKWVLKKN